MKYVSYFCVSLMFLFNIATAMTYTDVSERHWASSDIQKITDYGLTTGYSDGTFKGQKPVTRYELAKFLSKLIDQIENRASDDIGNQTISGNGGTPLYAYVDQQGVLVFENPGQFKYWLDGRIYIDGAYIDGSINDLESGIMARKIRLAIKTQLYRDWFGEFDISYQPNNSPATDTDIEIKDLYMGYSGISNTLLRFGNHKPPFSIEEMTTSRWTTFMERALPSVFSLERRMGLSVTSWGRMPLFGFAEEDLDSGWWLMTGLYGSEIGKGSEDGETESWVYSGRFVFRPVFQEQNVIQFGGSAYVAEPDIIGSTRRVEFKTRGESFINSEKLLDTGYINYVSHYLTSGVEMAIMLNSLLIQGEYMTTNIFRQSGYQDAYLHGYYLNLSYLLTGEHRVYTANQAEFGGVSHYTKEGALEVAYRFSSLDLNDTAASITGGSATNSTIGLNWYVKPNVTFMLNYIMMDHDSNANAGGSRTGNDDFNTLAFRVKYLF